MQLPKKIFKPHSLYHTSWATHALQVSPPPPPPLINLRGLVFQLSWQPWNPVLFGNIRNSLWRRCQIWWIHNYYIDCYSTATQLCTGFLLPAMFLCFFYLYLSNFLYLYLSHLYLSKTITYLKAVTCLLACLLTCPPTHPSLSFPNPCICVCCQGCPTMVGCLILYYKMQNPAWAAAATNLI